MKAFKVNEYITLKLEGGKTNIYFKNQLFNQCKFLMLTIPVDKISTFEEIESIDEALGKLNRKMDTHRFKISPEVEFWGHCSNLQVWYENNYDTRLLHRNIAFPLLKKLTDVGDFKANEVFKEEIQKRLLSGNKNIIIYLMNQNYFQYLDTQSLTLLFNSGDVILISKIMTKGFLTKELLPQIEEILFKKDSKFLKNLTSALREEKEELHEIFIILFHLRKLGSSKVNPIVKRELISYMRDNTLYSSTVRSRILSLLPEDDLTSFFNMLSPEFFDLLSESVLKDSVGGSDPIIYFFPYLVNASIDYLVKWIRRASEEHILHIFSDADEGLFFSFRKEHRQMFFKQLRTEDVSMLMGLFLTRLRDWSFDNPYNIHNYDYYGVEMVLEILLKTHYKYWKQSYAKIFKHIELEKELIFITYLYLAGVIDSLDSRIISSLFSKFTSEEIGKKFKLFESHAEPDTEFFLDYLHFSKLGLVGIEVIIHLMKEETDYEIFEGFIYVIEELIKKKENLITIYNGIINLFYDERIRHNHEINQLLINQLLELLPQEDRKRIIMDGNVGIFKRIFAFPVEWHYSSFISVAKSISISADELCFIWMPIDERKALEDLKREIGDVFNVLNGREVADAPNFEIDEDGHVIRLSLYGCRLKSLPDSMKSLIHLRYLSLTWNNLTHLPGYIRTFKSLKKLLVGANRLESLPESIGELSNLKHLYLVKNNLKYLPESIGDLKKLENLNINNNPIRTFPRTLINLQNLQYLYLDPSLYNQVPEIIKNSCTIRDKDHWTHLFIP